MTPVFGDTYFYIGLLNPKDAAHHRVRQVVADLRRHVVTTDWIMTELADGLSDELNRAVAFRFIHALRKNRNVTMIEMSRALMDRGLELYGDRPDKEWSLTDCISFVVMRDRDLTDALTADHHFVQAGFNAMLL